MKRSSTLGLLACVMLTASVAGCVVAPADPYYVGDTVTVAPPAPQVEVYGPAPGPGYIWMGGYWNWVGGRHVWVGGHWSSPRPGYRWVPHTWVRQGGGWRLAAGHWEHAR
jgi:hypothetical protein